MTLEEEAAARRRFWDWGRRDSSSARRSLPRTLFRYDEWTQAFRHGLTAALWRRGQIHDANCPSWHLHPLP